jgi:hypothetical protein
VAASKAYSADLAVDMNTTSLTIAGELSPDSLDV